MEQEAIEEEGVSFATQSNNNKCVLGLSLVKALPVIHPEPSNRRLGYMWNVIQT